MLSLLIQVAMTCIDRKCVFQNHEGYYEIADNFSQLAIGPISLSRVSVFLFTERRVTFDVSDCFFPECPKFYTGCEQSSKC